VAVDSWEGVNKSEDGLLHVKITFNGLSCKFLRSKIIWI